MPKPIKRPTIFPVGPSIAYIPLTKGLYALLDWDDALIQGQFNWSASWNPTINSYYAYRRRHMRAIFLHCEIVEPLDGFQVDHVSPYRTLDFRRANLRSATPSQNLANRRIPKTNTSGFKGIRIRFCKSGDKRYCAKIAINRKTIHLGTYDSMDMAVDAYRKAGRELFGEFFRVT